MKDKGDLYIIEFAHRIKVGRSKNVEVRFKNILSSAGLLEKEVVNFFLYEGQGIFEQKIIRLFKNEKIKGEWFNKKGIVSLFLREVKNKNKIDDNLLLKIQTPENQVVGSEKLYKLYEVIRNERKNIGFPSSPKLKDILKNNIITYRHTNYILSKDLLSFRRDFKFDISNPTKTQCIECLKITRNNTICTSQKERIQEIIDEFYNNNFSNLKLVLKLIFELSKEEEKLINSSSIKSKEFRIKDKLSIRQLKKLKAKNIDMIDLFDDYLFFHDSSVQIRWLFKKHTEIRNQLILNKIPFRNFTSDYDFNSSFDDFIISKFKQKQIINSESLILFDNSLMFEYEDKFCFWHFPINEHEMITYFLKNNNLIFKKYN